MTAAASTSTLSLTIIQQFCLVLAIIATGYGVFKFLGAVWRLVWNFRQGQKDPGRWGPFAPRFKHLLGVLLGHSTFKNRPLVRWAHFIVMWSFPLLFLTLVSSYAQIRNPQWILPVLGNITAWNWLTELIALACFVAISCLIVIRLAAGKEQERQGKPNRFYGSAHRDAYFIEFVVWMVALCVLVIHALTAAYGLGVESAPAALSQYPLTGLIARLFTGVSLHVLADGVAVVATIKILVSMWWMVAVARNLGMGVAWHRFLAIFNVYTSREPGGAKSLGAAGPLMVDGIDVNMETIDDLPEDSQLGAHRIGDFTWKNLLDFSTCTECGRCQEVCPAWASGKELSPKDLLGSLRKHGVEASTKLKGVPVAGDDQYRYAASAEARQSSRELWDAPLLPGVISDQALWDCTTCGACVEVCPVDIETVDHILNLRRNQVLMEAQFPKELTKTYRNLEQKGNPWGLPPRKRLDWLKQLDFPVPLWGQDIESLTEVDYLFWVCCSGAYTDHGQVATQAVAQLLNLAGVSFGILGDQESNCGDVARRTGNELLYLQLATANIELLQAAEATKIVVTCAHCYNTLTKEYPQLGGNFEVIHHSQLLNRLVQSGALHPVPPAPGEELTVTYQDPCYLGRHNGVYSDPREVLAATGMALVEMASTRQTAMCCGGGGGHAFLEENPETSVTKTRLDQARNTGADLIATACPYCPLMFQSAPTGGEAPAVVKDISVLLLEAVQRGLKT